MSVMKGIYVAYGSNLNKEQMEWRCPGARVVGTGFLEDYELLFKGSKTGAYCTVERKPGAKVPVAFWETTAEDEENLDRYEGCPTFYYKQRHEFKVRDKKTGKVSTRDGYIYIMHEDRPLGIPSRAYMHTCLQGYRDFGFDPEVLLKALAETKERMDLTLDI